MSMERPEVEVWCPPFSVLPPLFDTGSLESGHQLAKLAGQQAWGNYLFPPCPS